MRPQIALNHICYETGALLERRFPFNNRVRISATVEYVTY